ncbi:DUF2281 domain-containing protein [Flagellatimonas centrodinii]|uniref:DUF2281 domain-containing protein n=1 Tax=Flagellatimonas centrodinii TaxID=2806210 RepID=UPI001FEDDD90|nr:DUF2281 domain-containing protein [Flagellatimonas centrodinii]ULQ46628.1 DUF2281 domain-containing protein [Flagellatimonas centrodinii]
MTTADRIYESVKPLPEPLAQEVLDFVTFLKTRRLGADIDDLIAAQAASLAHSWDNADDEAWNDVSAV